MKFGKYIETHRQLIHSTICKYVPVDRRDGQANTIMRDYIDRQGKYARPGLLMLAGQLYGAKVKELVLPAAAQQVSEDWILMQDDSADDSELRRGKPAIQKIHGWIQAMNASNAGHMAMWRMLKDFMLQVGERKGNRVFEKFYDMLDYTIEGQHIENQFIHYTKSMRHASEALYMRIAQSKTCYYTIYGPLQIGAIIADQPESVLQMLKEMGNQVGIAFQIMDDVLDMTADEAKFGKKRYGDLYEGKLTLIMLHAYQKASEAEKKKIDAVFAKKRMEKTREDIDFLVDIIGKYKGIEYAKKLAKEYGERSKATIKKYDKMLPENEYKQTFLSAIEAMFVRER